MAHAYHHYARRLDVLYCNGSQKLGLHEVRIAHDRLFNRPGYQDEVWKRTIMWRPGGRYASNCFNDWEYSPLNRAIHYDQSASWARFRKMFHRTR